ncbi:uncharacterized protein [Acropora muricata]|uniref:uncharacterized protein n=1 Tax=Acropora muricata TaxID=159855 RepID=UPI0034E3EED1
MLELLYHFLKSFVQEIEAMASDCGMDILGAKANDESGGSNDESGNTDVFDKIRSLFGEDIYASLQKEEISSPQLIADLADRDADAPIFGKLGFTYGKAARFKQEFEMKKTSRSSGHARPCSPAPSKPTMAEMSNFTPEMKRLYLSKRKKIGILAASKWGNSCPKFNSPEAKTDLKEFCAKIASECAIPEINFNEEGIANHVKTFF